MLSRKKDSLLTLCLLLSCCQKIDLANPEDVNPAGSTEENVSIVSTGEGSRECPYTVADIRCQSLPQGEAVWVIGYMVGTAPRTMNNASFIANAENQSNILLSYDSLCTDTALCIPVELSSDKWRTTLSLPMNTAHFRKCLLLNGTPKTYLNRKGLRNISAGLWMDGFDISTVAPQQWNVVDITTSSQK